MSSGRKEDQGRLLNSIKRIFRGSTKGNKLNRVKSHKPQPVSSGRDSFSNVVIIHKSRSEPDLRANVIDHGAFLRQLAELKCKSITDSGVACPVKAAKRLGITGSSTTMQDNDLNLAVNMPDKAAKTLGVCTANLKAAKTLGITTPDHPTNNGSGTRYRTAEDFLKKIGAHASNSAPSLRKQKTSPALPSKNNNLLRKLALQAQGDNGKRRQVDSPSNKERERNYSTETPLPDTPPATPPKPVLAINKRLLLKKCESDTRLIVPNRVTK
eukprot:sb/3468210/